MKNRQPERETAKEKTHRMKQREKYAGVIRFTDLTVRKRKKSQQIKLPEDIPAVFKNQKQTVKRR